MRQLHKKFLGEGKNETAPQTVIRILKNQRKGLLDEPFRRTQDIRRIFTS
jgi:hypothetical protein